MTPLTQCYAQGRSPLLLRPGSLARATAILAATAALSMSVTYLRFATRDLQIESSKLQKARLQLISQKNALISEVEQLKRLDNLSKNESVSLGFCKIPPDRSVCLAVSDRAAEKWRGEASRMYEEDENARAQPAERLLAVVGERVISWSSVSIAREPLGGEK